MKKIIKLLISVLTAFALISCGSDEELNEITTPMMENYDLGFSRRSLGYYKKDLNSNEYPSEIPSDQRDFELEKEEDYEVSYEKVNGTSSYSDICSMGALDSILYPGSIVDISNEAYAPIDLKLAPLTISANLEANISNNNAVLYSEIQNPSLSQVRQGIKTIISNNVTNANNLQSTIEYDIREIETQNEFDLNIGFGLKFKKLAISDNFNYNKIDKQTNLAVVFKQNFLRIDIDHKGITSLLDKSVTNKQMNDAFRGKIPAYVASVSYGRIIVMTIQTNYSKEEISNALTASWGQDGKATYNKGLFVKFENGIKNIAKDTQTDIHYFEYGGGSGSGGVVNTIDSFYNSDSSNSMSSMFSEQFAMSDKTVGLPISYTLMDAKGSIVKLQDSRDYYIKHIEYKPKRIMNWSYLNKLYSSGEIFKRDVLKLDFSSMINYDNPDQTEINANNVITVPSNIKELHLKGANDSMNSIVYQNLSFNFGRRGSENDIDIYLSNISFTGNVSSNDGVCFSRALNSSDDMRINLHIDGVVELFSQNNSPAIVCHNLCVDGSGDLNLKCVDTYRELKEDEEISMRGTIDCTGDIFINLSGSLNITGLKGWTNPTTGNGIDGGYAIKGENVYIKTSLESKFKGGNGGDGKTSLVTGGNGGNGGPIFKCQELKLETKKATFTTGNGGNGASGHSYDRTKNEFGYASDGRDGGDGGKGGNSSEEVFDVSSLELIGDDFIFNFFNGKGGNGANGGDGEFAGFDKNPTANAGKGGDGGKGGDSICPSLDLINPYAGSVALVLNTNNGGNGGDGGNGGHSDEEWFIGKIRWSNPGEGGISGPGGISFDNFNYSPNIKSVEKKTTGVNGTSGKNGEKGKSDYY